MPRRKSDRDRARADQKPWPSPEYRLLVATLLVGVAVAALAVGRHLAMLIGAAAPGALH